MVVLAPKSSANDRMRLSAGGATRRLLHCTRTGIPDGAELVSVQRSPAEDRSESSGHTAEVLHSLIRLSA
jgi:hypothetical protein